MESIVFDVMLVDVTFGNSEKEGISRILGLFTLISEYNIYPDNPRKTRVFNTDNTTSGISPNRKLLPLSINLYLFVSYFISLELELLITLEGYIASGNSVIAGFSSIAETIRFFLFLPPAFIAVFVIISLSLLVFDAMAVAGAFTEFDTTKLNV